MTGSCGSSFRASSAETVHAGATAYYSWVDDQIGRLTFTDDIARGIGFKGIASGPMVRSSYKADELLALART